MKREIVLPQLGPKVESGTMVTLYHREGDKIQQDELLYDVESEKAIHEVESPVSGTLIRYLVSEGDEVKVGDPLMEIEVSDCDE